MATTEDVKRSQARRAKREHAQAAAEVAAKQESLVQGKPAKKTTAVRRAEAEAAIEAPLKKAATQTRESKKMVRARHEVAVRKQAQADALRTPEMPDLSVPIGETPPLHVLRARAKLIESAERDAATEIAVEIGRSARDLLAGKELRGRHSRHRRLAEAEAMAARIKPQE